MKKQKFELRIAVGSDDKKVGVKVEVWKDGKYYRYVVEKSGDVEKLSKIFDEVNKEFPGSYLVKIEDGKVSRYRKN